MSAPLPLALPSGSSGALALAFAIGLGFGWCLERAGLGSARKLMGQFHLTDLAVFKVMFSAIVTAMLGLFWLSRFGVVDISRVYVPETFVAPQIAGGIVFGAGMALAGLCPGTSCVAAATGRVDGIAVVGGFFAGVLATGLVLPAIAQFYGSGARGTLTLDATLGASAGSVILVVVACALAGFVVATRIERRASRPLRTGEPANPRTRASSTRRALAGVAAALAMLAAWIGTPVAAEQVATRDVVARSASAPPVIEARRLAEWIREGRSALYVLDLRGDSAFASRHVPSAERADFARLDSLPPAKAATVVVYSDDDVRDAQAWANLAARGHRQAYVLDGGLPAWEEEVMAPVLHGDSADYLAALSRYFGGAPRVGAAAQRRSPVAAVRDSTDQTTTTDAFGDAERRGC